MDDKMRFIEFINEMTRKSESDAISRMDDHMIKASEHVGYINCAKNPSEGTINHWVKEVKAFLNNGYDEYKNTPNKKPIKLKKIAHQRDSVISNIVRQLDQKNMSVHDNFDRNEAKKKIDSFIGKTHQVMYDNYHNDYSFTNEWIKQNLYDNGE